MESLEARVLFTAVPASPRRVVGYFPDYEYGAVNQIDLSAMTHINYFAITDAIIPSDKNNPVAAADGSLDTSQISNLANLDDVVSRAHALNESVSITLGASDFDSVVSNTRFSNSLSTFVTNVMGFVSAHKLDGIDIDWEPSPAQAGGTELADYGKLVDAFYAKTNPLGLTLSTAVNAEFNDLANVNKSELSWVEDMAYDFQDQSPDVNSPLLESENSLTTWSTTYGVPASKLVLAVPFYGRNTNNTNLAEAYSQLVQDFGYQGANVNQLGGYYFNGGTTITAKANYVLNNGYGGIGIWELGQDVFPDNGSVANNGALLPLIKTAMQVPNSAPTANAGGSYNVNEGGTVTLAGVGNTSTAGRSIEEYQWDFNYDGNPQDFTPAAAGANAWFSAASIDGPATRTIALRVQDTPGLISSISTAVVNIKNVAPTGTFSGTTVTLGSAGAVSFTNVTDPSAADRAAGFKYSYDFDNDGTFDVTNSTSANPIVPASYLATAGGHVVKGRVQDKDGDFTDYTTTITVNSSAQPSPAQSAKLTGTVIGTSGSFNNSGNTIQKAVDGDINSYYDAATANGDWVGLDLGSTYTLTSVQFAPRAGWGARMVGGTFQASNDPSFSTGVVNLYSVTSAPTDGTYTQPSVTTTGGYRYVRYLSPNGGWGNVAEVAFYGAAAATATPPANPPSNPPSNPPTNPPAGTASLLSGATIGTTGSFANVGNTRDKALDGDLNTFFDAPIADGAWVGLDLGAAYSITQVSFAARTGWGNRMVGGQFQGSNDPNFVTGVVTLSTLSSAPASGTLTQQAISNSGTFRYVRYLSPAGGWGNIAEVKFFGLLSPTTAPIITNPAAPPKLSGIVIGTAGSYLNQGNTIANVFDGNLSTFFDGPTANGEWVGLDLGTAKSVTSIRFAPRAGWGFRMLGGVFQGSNDPNFSSQAGVVTTLATITSTPVDGWNAISLSNVGAFRYVRYLSPNGGSGNVAEIEFYG